jgi:hypothetical protein
VRAGLYEVESLDTGRKALVVLVERPEAVDWPVRVLLVEQTGEAGDVAVVAEVATTGRAEGGRVQGA